MMLAFAPLQRRVSEIPTIRLFEPPLSRDPLPPVIFFAVPKYTLTQHERETIAACLVLEAANQGEFGMRSVMAVIRNRARALPELFAPTVLRSKQFSALNKVTAPLAASPWHMRLHERNVTGCGLRQSSS